MISKDAAGKNKYMNFHIIYVTLLFLNVGISSSEIRLTSNGLHGVASQQTILFLPMILPSEILCYLKDKLKFEYTTLCQARLQNMPWD
jgi:hypothetical protein